MNVTIISRDKELYRLCRDILPDVTKQHWNLSVAEPEEAPQNADLYLWDVQPSTIPAGFHGGSATHLCLVSRKDLPLPPELGRLNPSILLKPVTRATLTAFLTLAVAAHQHRLSDTTTLRADLDEMLQCLIQTNLKLQEYDQDRTAFLARALHDFRAPLTALSGYCGLLLSEPLGPLNKEQREVIQRMLNSTQRLSRMSAAMFQLSVGRQVKRMLDLQPGDIQSCLDQALHEISPFADDKSITITMDVSPCVRQLFFETGQLEQVLINILHNACKFTAKSGMIEVSGRPYFWDRRTNASTVSGERRTQTVREPNSYRVNISNSGPPIPREHLSRIFEEYTSYAGGRDRSGGGLGLAICRMIITEHEGKIWAENTSAGPVICFVIPMRTEASRTPQKSSAGLTFAEAG
ncbi:MAG: HAMP domain-containing sensor histidine kinase [Candidatus Solibacter sp.]